LNALAPVYGELLLRRATWHETLLHPFLYVIDFKRALSFGEGHGLTNGHASTRPQPVRFGGPEQTERHMLSSLYLNEVDRMLEKAIQVSRKETSFPA